MKKSILTLSLLSLALGACSSFEKQFADDIVASSTNELSLCDIQGVQYAGLESQLAESDTLKVLIIHGVGTHHPGYSDKLQLNLMTKMGVNQKSRLSKNITLLDSAYKNTKIGHLRTTQWHDECNDKSIIFYELTWSMITQPYKDKLSFDTSEDYSSYRVPFNNTMKGFFDNVLPDPMVYISDPHELIIDSSEQALCWLLKTNYTTMPDNQSLSCEMTLPEKIDLLATENLSVITHSLGSEIVVDTFTKIAEKVADYPHKTNLKKSINKLQDKDMTIYLMANQLPILLIDKPKPPIHNEIKSYCTQKGNNYDKRLFNQFNIIAFSDPNDLLSYAIPQSFADSYLDSRLCPMVSNVMVNVAPEISAFGIGVVNPISAHIDYQNSEKVINLMTEGTENFNSNPDLNKECQFIELKKE